MAYCPGTTGFTVTDPTPPHASLCVGTIAGIPVGGGTITPLFQTRELKLRSWVYWFTSAVPTLEGLRQKYGQFKSAWTM